MLSAIKIRDLYKFSVLRCCKRYASFSNPQVRNPMQGLYEMPDKYRNSFFLVNASFFDNSNWYIHNAYEIYFTNLIEELKTREPTYNENTASETVRDLINSIDLCNELLDVNFIIKNKQMRKEMIRGYRAHHCINYMNRPCLGGLRLQKGFKKDHCKALALLSTYRNACIGMNLAGSFGGIKIDPNEYSQEELKTILQTYTAQLTKHNFCGQNIDIMEPDMYCGEKEMDWISQCVLNNQDKLAEVISVGKPQTLGGFTNYNTTIVEGVFAVLDYFINNKKIMDRISSPIGFSNKTFIIQGLGKTGANIAAYLEKAGAKCVGVKESDAYLYSKNGIPVDAIVFHKNNTGSILNFCEGVKPYKTYDLFKEECDILILAANHKSVQCYLADKIKAKIIVEAANGGITPSANKSLLGRNKLILPDILINSGASLASYFEYLRNIEKLPFGKIVEKYATTLVRNTLNTEGNEEELVYKAMKCIIINTIKEVNNVAIRNKLDLDLRTAAYVNAINKMFTSIYNSKQY